jgi:hypothetical protein
MLHAHLHHCPNSHAARPCTNAITPAGWLSQAKADAAASPAVLCHLWGPRVRRPVAGWRGNDQLPQGLLYEGVWEAPLQLYGESGAQSSILPALDAALGVQHAEGW